MEPKETTKQFNKVCTKGHRKKETLATMLSIEPQAFGRLLELSRANPVVLQFSEGSVPSIN